MEVQRQNRAATGRADVLGAAVESVPTRMAKPEATRPAGAVQRLAPNGPPPHRTPPSNSNPPSKSESEVTLKRLPHNWVSTSVPRGR